jgi:hypothetical protein
MSVGSQTGSSSELKFRGKIDHNRRTGDDNEAMRMSVRKISCEFDNLRISTWTTDENGQENDHK